MMRNYLNLTWKVLSRNKFFTFVSLFGISFTIGILLVVASLMDNMVNSSYPEGNRDRSLYIRNLKLSDGQNTNWIDEATPYFINEYVGKLKTPEAVAMISRPEKNFPIALAKGKKMELNLRYSNAAFWQICIGSFGRWFKLEYTIYFTFGYCRQSWW